MAQVGLRATDDIDEKRIHIDVNSEISELQTDKGPLSKLIREAGSQGTEKPEYMHFEGDLRALTVAVNGSHTDSVTTIQLDSDEANNVHDDMILHNPSTGERMQIQSVDRTTDEITVERGFGSSAGSAIDDAEEICIIGNANEEGAGAPDEINAGLTKVSNYTQIFRHSFSVTGTLASTVLEAGNPDWDRLSKQKSLEHIRALEMAYFFGVKNEDLSGEEPQRTTAGIDEHITSNVFDVGGSQLTAPLLDEYAEELFAYGSDRKLMFTGANAIRSINDFARDQLRVEQGEDTYGLRVQRLVTGFGVLDIVYHKLLSRHGYSDTAFILDPENIRERPLNNNGESRYNQLRMNIQNPDEDRLKSEYLTEVGLECFQEVTHGKLENIGTP
ncbi:MAG: DUF5309 domain-containing protein [Clostridiales bacterium]|nr:DUF5309 domain-containing protein [Clostridiales bacterium]